MKYLLLTVLIVQLVTSCNEASTTSNLSMAVDTTAYASIDNTSSIVDESKLTGAQLALFKGFKDNSSVKYDEHKMKVSSIGLNSQWTFDSHGDEYMYRKAERGSKYLTARLSFTSESKDPSLPAIAVYRIIDGKTELLGMMKYEFVRWKNYGSYLGNYADYGNDFSQTATVNFSCGLSVDDEWAKDYPVIVVAYHKGGFERSESRFDTPPVEYIQMACNVTNQLDPAEAGKSYTVLKVLNRNKFETL